MRPTIMLTVLGLLAIVAAALPGDRGAIAGPAGERVAQDKEVTRNPAILISPTLKTGELTVYGLKLGSSTDAMPNDAGVSAVGIPERPQDMVYVGRNVRYYANDRKIYRITIMGDLAKQLPTYDAARLQMTMGKADEAIESPAEQDTRLSFFSRHVRYTVHSFRALSLVTEVDIYAP